MNKKEQINKLREQLRTLDRGEREVEDMRRVLNMLQESEIIIHTKNSDECISICPEDDDKELILDALREYVNNKEILLDIFMDEILKG